MRGAKARLLMHKDERSLEGIAAAEAANSAMCPGAVVPMLLFGIPGDAVTAVMLGVFMIRSLISAHIF